MTFSPLSVPSTRTNSNQLTVAGLIFGCLLFAGAFLIFLQFARVVIDQVAVVQSLRTISGAAHTHSNKYHRGFPPTMAALGPPSAGDPDAAAAGLIDAQLASGVKYGYVFAYAPRSSHYGVAPEHFGTSADPMREGVNGVRHFFIDDTGVVRTEWRAPAGAASTPEPLQSIFRVP